MMLKTGMGLSQDYTIFNYGHPIPQKDVKSQDRTIVAGPGVNSEPKFVLTGNSKEKVGKETPPDVFIVHILETFLATKLDKACGNANGDIVESFIKPRISTIFDHTEYFLGGPRTLIEVSGPHEDFQKCFWDMARWKIFFRWILQTNQDARSIWGLRTKAEYSRTYFKSTARGSYDTGNSGDWKEWHGIPNASTK